MENSSLNGSSSILSRNLDEVNLFGDRDGAIGSGKESKRTINDDTDGHSARSGCGSPVLQPSEVEEILERSEMVPEGRRARSATLVGSSEASERDENDSLDTSSTATEEDATEEDSSDTMTESQEDALSTAVASVRGERRRSSFLEGVWACLGPVTSLWKGRETREQKEDEDTFEVAFADIKELEFIGSGAQGAVFCGEYRGEMVAVKKVKDLAYCDEIRQLRKLSHRNIVQFRCVCVCVCECLHIRCIMSTVCIYTGSVEAI